MKKIIFAIVGAALLFFGAVDYIDYAAGAFMNYNRSLLIAGLVILAVAGILHLRQKWQQRAWKSYGPLVLAASAIIFSATNVCAETAHKLVLTPPEKWSMLHWNPSAMSGPETWLGVFLVGVVSAAAYYLFWSVFIGTPKRGVDNSYRRR